MRYLQQWQFWTVSQKCVVTTLVILLTLALGFQLWRRPVGVSDPPSGNSPRGGEIADRLDPNTADAAALAAIPNLGEIRAKEIVDYRQTFAIQHPGEPAFTRPEDLMRIKRIGAATVASMAPYLLIAPTPAARTATRPAIH